MTETSEGRCRAQWRPYGVAFSCTDDGAGIRNPYGDYPGYLSLMIERFNRADEDVAGASYVHDLSFIVNCDGQIL
jgi:hypothetical protein